MAKDEKAEVAVYEPIDKEEVKARILEIRGLRVILDSDIAMYFGVTTGNLNKARNRNADRFPSHFSFVLTDEEVSLFQNGIAMQTKGKKGGRSNNPTVYTEQGVAMLTSVLHSPQAISASIQIMEAFVEMSHYIRQNQQLLPYGELKSLELGQHELSAKVKQIEEKMVTKSDLSEFMKLFDAGLKEDEILILDGEPFKADMAYQKIYRKAKKNIIVVDDYLGVKTLRHLAHAKDSVDITIISDNQGYRPLRLSEYNDYLREYPGRTISFVTSQNKAHDRYIVLDFGTKTTRVYHCGASSKDAGKKITTITEIKGIVEYKDAIANLLNNPALNLS